MKKISIVLLSVAMLFAFTACNNNTEPVAFDTIKGYFTDFSTDYILGMVTKAVDEDYSDTEGITNVKTTYDSEKGTLTSVMSLEEFRFNGKADGTNQRAVSGTVTVTLTGTLSNSSFTATTWNFEGTGVNMKDITKEASLDPIVVDIDVSGTFKNDDSSISAPKITIENNKVTAVEDNNTNFHFSKATGTITCGLVEFEVTDLF